MLGVIYDLQGDLHRPKRDGKHWVISHYGKAFDGFDTCIRLDVPEYFTHGSHQDILNHAQKKAFIKFMESKPERSRYLNFKNNWEVAAAEWNLGNTNEVENDMPDYNELPGGTNGND